MSTVPEIDEDRMKQLMLDTRSIAVVGLSNDPGRASFEVSSYIQSQGYQLLPVNPNEDQVLGRKAIGSVTEAAEPVDTVVVFRRSDAIPTVVDDIAKMSTLPKLVWLQLGIRNDEAVQSLVDKGVSVVQDRCFMVEHRRLLGHVNA
ncbi:MAG: CoA-binding protein [Bacilli bacterium]|nr:CoA-binding protein [Bacilli bacterium]